MKLIGEELSAVLSVCSFFGKEYAYYLHPEKNGAGNGGMMMGSEQLAFVTVPVQQWTGLYTKEEALQIGTIFPDLNKPFLAAQAAGGCVCSQPASHGLEGLGVTDGRSQQMLEIMQVSFMLDDVLLYLDTHPTQKEAQALRTELTETRKKLLKALDESGCPLTSDCSGSWTEGPLPWEGGCL